MKRHGFILLPPTIAEVSAVLYLLVIGVRTPSAGRRVLKPSIA